MLNEVVQGGKVNFQKRRGTTLVAPKYEDTHFASASKAQMFKSKTNDYQSFGLAHSTSQELKMLFSDQNLFNNNFKLPQIHSVRNNGFSGMQLHKINFENTYKPKIER